MAKHSFFLPRCDLWKKIGKFIWPFFYIATAGIQILNFRTTKATIPPTVPASLKFQMILKGCTLAQFGATTIQQVKMACAARQFEVYIWSSIFEVQILNFNLFQDTLPSGRIKLTDINRTFPRPDLERLLGLEILSGFRTSP